MKPIFTMHAGEYLVAEEIERNFKDILVWIPSKDTGIDLLLTDSNSKKTSTIQVKFSKDFNPTHGKKKLKESISGAGWWTLNKDKIENSKADFWIFVIYSFGIKTNDFIIIPTSELIRLFVNLQRETKLIHCYFSVTNHGTAFETRGLSVSELETVCDGKALFPERDVTCFLNKWSLITNFLI
ncbi:hypothetical protein JYB64_06080 [Algoriphagus aestuarii]|nr:hypothetical protein [Algoriphagus aestuarii]